MAGIKPVAQMTIFPCIRHEWVTSGHNVLLDILIWNGIPLGLLIIAYMAVWLLWLKKYQRHHFNYCDADGECHP